MIDHDALQNQQRAELRQLLSAVGRKDADAFRRLYDLTAPNLLGFAVRILRKRELAEEVVQESFVSVWNNAASYQASLSAPMTWLVTIVRNRAFDLLRTPAAKVMAVELDADLLGDGLMAEILEDREGSADGAFDALARGEDSRALAACLAQLEALHRQAVALAFYHDLSHSEVAAQLALPIGTIKTWIRRGLQKLHVCLDAGVAGSRT